jgi:1-acyl-sn-glycerol-3-phosphate acyltransferase
MNAARSTLFALLFYAGSAVAVLAAIPIAVLGRRPLVALVHAWARWHRWCARWILGIRARVEGRPPTGPVLVAAKHQSMFETIELVLLLDEPAVVLKRQLAEIPGWGWAARRYGVIPVDREAGAPALRRMLVAAKEAAAAGRPILIFPEGTRVAPGEQPQLQPGFAGLYSALGMPVAPVALDSGRLWPRRSFVKRPGIITFRFEEQVKPGLKRGEVEERVRRRSTASSEPPRD